MLSVVVNFYNNRREAANTLYSLSRAYQRGADEFEVLAIDHGSTLPLAEAEVRAFGAEFSYRFVATDAVSPVAAINAACREAHGDKLLVLIDGAHILSPGVYALAERAFTHFASPFLAVASFHLGPKQQNQSMLEGYNQQVEDEMLARSGWRENGYRLHSISGSFADGSLGWFGAVLETGCFGLRKQDFLSLGGFDERFVSRGGGLVNLDLYQRALARRDLEYVMLLGESSFHQFHGGVATNAPKAVHPWEEFHTEYQRIRGRPFERVPRRPFYFGTIADEAIAPVRYSAEHGLDLWLKLAAAMNARQSVPAKK